MGSNKVYPSRVLICACFLLLSSCVLRPEWQRLAIDGNLKSGWLDTGQFRHRWLSSGVPGSHLRIYIEGDGTPWIRQNRVSVDPTPINPVLLRLMHDTGQPAVYLGRPCYFGTATDSGCHERWWTFDRYGQVVVDSMCQAANEISRGAKAETVQLIGYSGGAAIAVGMSACTDRLVALTTIAGNLDPAAWTAYHGYSSLLDVAPFDKTRPAAGSFIESHWQCSKDTNVPPAITDKYFASRPAARRHVIDGCTHSTGWDVHWSRVIDVSAQPQNAALFF